MRFKVALATALVAGALSGFGQEKPADKKAADDAAMMQAMMAAATPGAAHKHLDQFIGTWDTSVKFYAAPGAPPMTSAGTSENKWVLGGRYVEQRFRGDMMGAPFEGLGYTGYDNVKKQYWGSWIDNMSTGVMNTTGSSADGKTFAFTGTFPDPMTGKDATCQEKITIVSADQHLFEMWGAGPDGKDFKMMEITYTRRK